MVLDVILALFSGIAFAFLGLAYKLADRLACRTAPFVFVFALSAGIATGIRSYFEISYWADTRLWLLGSCMGFCFFSAVFLLIAANKRGPSSITWTVLNLSLLIPILLSPFLFGEHLTALDGVTVTLFVVMMFFFTRANPEGAAVQKKSNTRYLLLLVSLFLLNGWGGACAKYKYRFFGDTNTAAVLTIMFLSCAVCMLAIMCAKNSRPFFTRGEVKAGALAGACSFAGNMFYITAISLPAIVVFPVSQGISLLGGIFLIRLLYREKLSGAQEIGVVLAVTVLILAIFRTSLYALITTVIP